MSEDAIDEDAYAEGKDTKAEILTRGGGFYRQESKGLPVSQMGKVNMVAVENVE